MSTVTFNPGASLKNVHNDDGHITEKEWNDWAKWYENIGNRGKDFTFGGKQYKYSDLLAMKKFVVDRGTPPPAIPADGKDIDGQTKVITQLHAQLETIEQQITQLKAQITTEEAKNQTAETKAKIEELKLKQKVLESKKQVKIAKQKQNLSTLKRMHGAKKVQGKASWWKTAGMTVPKHLQGKSDGKGGISASMTSGKAATANAPQQRTSGKAQSGAKGGKAATAGKGGGWGPTSSGWGGKAMSGPSFSSGAYAQSLYMEDSIMNSWDSINKSQNRGKELMQLLFYYMRMAMSGDLTAMYNMMKAVLYIISKDKALQQVHMANKLIELQDASRRATDKLLNFNADQNDPNSQMEFTKLLQSVKSDSDSIATSQKLIAQMMEEMAQIVETLTNVTKGALDASGRVLRTVSRFT